MFRTSFELLDFFGLKVGDYVCCDGTTYEVRDDATLLRRDSIVLPLHYLLDKEYTKNKKVGDLICGEIKCDNCPLRMFSCVGVKYGSLFNKWEAIKHGILAADVTLDVEIDVLIMDRLNKVVFNG